MRESAKVFDDGSEHRSTRDPPRTIRNERSVAESGVRERGKRREERGGRREEGGEASRGKERRDERGERRDER